jgi:hypothetical protein
METGRGGNWTHGQRREQREKIVIVINVGNTKTESSRRVKNLLESRPHCGTSSSDDGDID